MCWRFSRHVAIAQPGLTQETSAETGNAADVRFAFIDLDLPMPGQGRSRAYSVRYWRATLSGLKVRPAITRQSHAVLLASVGD
jgi:hypothetical protein